MVQIVYDTIRKIISAINKRTSNSFIFFITKKQWLKQDCECAHPTLLQL